MLANDSSACPPGLIAHAVPRRLRANLARMHSHPIQRTLQAQGAPAHHVEIRHRHPHVSMPEQFLHGTNVTPGFQQVRRRAVAPT